MVRASIEEALRLPGNSGWQAGYVRRSHVRTALLSDRWGQRLLPSTFPAFATEGQCVRVGSLFTGIGGFDEAFRQAGFDIVWQVENNAFCQQVLRKRFPEAQLLNDVKEAGKHNLHPVDVICGGFPCQDISVAGKRAGLAGQRSGLFYEFARIADELAAQWLVIENVFGLLSSPEGDRGRDFQAVLGELTGFYPEVPKDGWRNSGVCHGPKRTAAWRVLDSRYFGVAQRRRRVFIVIGPRARSAFEVLFKFDGMPWDPPASRKEAEGVAGTLSSAASRSRGGGTDPGAIVPDVAGTLGGASQTGGYRTTDLDNNGALIPETVSPLRTNGFRSDAGDSRAELIPQVAWCLQERDHKGVDSDTKEGHLIPVAFDPTQTTSKANRSQPQPDGPVHTLASDQHVAAVAFHGTQDPDISGDMAHPLTNTNAVAFQSRYVRNGRGAPDDVVPALTAEAGRKGDSAPLVAFNGIRRLTPTEYERLQGFEDGWTLWTPNAADSPRYKALGNAVTVTVARWLAERI